MATGVFEVMSIIIDVIFNSKAVERLIEL